jgi:hypothetical protein
LASSNSSYKVKLYLNLNDDEELTDWIFFVHNHSSHTFSAYLIESIKYMK